ncbi:MAG: transcriptional repressor [Dehalococcoidia bacterium]|jgi:Fur family transcriptional regulator, peroxide stress response regulator|nr:transcriptional repressor [Dehalococcoidia bacterium]
MTTRYEDIETTLRERGFRMTPQRLAIVRIIAEDVRHPTVDQVFETVHETFPTTSRATVYKTFELLKDIGELLEFEFSEGGNRYDAKRVGPHAHVLCDGCGRMEDLEIDAADGSLVAQANANSSFHVTRQRVEFYGLCAKCQVQESAAAG